MGFIRATWKHNLTYLPRSILTDFFSDLGEMFDDLLKLYLIHALLLFYDSILTLKNPIINTPLPAKKACPFVSGQTVFVVRYQIMLPPAAGQKLPGLFHQRQELFPLRGELREQRCAAFLTAGAQQLGNLDGWL